MSINISVVIPAYNAGKYIHRTLDSVLGQTLPPDEIIAVDDGSTDDTAEKVKSYDPHVTYIYQENGGASRARNLGITNARNEWIAFLDADDEWLPDKLQRQTEILKRNTDLDWCTGNFIRRLDQEQREAPDVNPEHFHKRLQGRDYFDNYFQAHRWGGTGHTDTMLIRRSVLIQAGLFEEQQRQFEDMDLWFRIAYRSPQIGFVAEPLAVHHREVQDSVSREYKDSRIYCDVIERHLPLAAHHHQMEYFLPCAAHILRGWIRSMLFEERPREIRQMLDRFKSILPAWYRGLLRLLTTFPHSTALGCLGISQVVRKLRLRQKVVPRPLEWKS